MISTLHGRPAPGAARCRRARTRCRTCEQAPAEPPRHPVLTYPIARSKERDLIAGRAENLASLRSGSRAEPQPAPGRGPHLTARAVALSRTLTAFGPVSCARLERTAGLDHQRAGRQDPEPPAHPALRCCPAGPSDPRYLRPRPDGPASAAAVEAGPVTGEGPLPFRCLGITLQRAAVERAAESNLRD